MPLRALIDDVERISFKINDTEWTDIKNKTRRGLATVKLPCCKQRAFLRTSSMGLRHFVHARGVSSCDGKLETLEHLQSKTEIVEACLDNGWKAIPEFSENDWRADVLAIKNELRIAFEVQWSEQTAEETIFRQERYKKSKVRGCWFFRTVPKGLVAEIPVFKIQQTPNADIVINFSNEDVSIRGFVDRLLTRKIKYCKNYRLLPKQEIEIVISGIKCWNCEKPQHVYTVNPYLKSCCNKPRKLDVDFHPNVIEAVREICNIEGSQFKIGEIKMRFSKILGKNLLWFGCYSCDEIIGDAPIEDSFLRIENSECFFRRIVDFGKTERIGEPAGGHWCYNNNREFCE